MFAFLVSYSQTSLSINMSLCPSVQNTSFCQSVGGGIESHLVTALLKWFSHLQVLLLPNFENMGDLDFKLI